MPSVDVVGRHTDVNNYIEDRASIVCIANHAYRRKLSESKGKYSNILRQASHGNQCFYHRISEGETPSFISHHVEVQRLSLCGKCCAHDPYREPSNLCKNL